MGYPNCRNSIEHSQGGVDEEEGNNHSTIPLRDTHLSWSTDSLEQQQPPNHKCDDHEYLDDDDDDDEENQDDGMASLISTNISDSNTHHKRERLLWARKHWLPDGPWQICKVSLLDAEGVKLFKFFLVTILCLLLMHYYAMAVVRTKWLERS
jgi:hypothetical protein